MTLRSPGTLLVDARVLLTPLIHQFDLGDGTAWLAYEVPKWIPGGSLSVVFPAENTLGNEALGLRDHLVLNGIPVGIPRARAPG